MRIQSRPLMAGGAVAFIAMGCAHHQANQYAYAPPLAPPVYPQPQAATPMMVAAPVAAPATTGVPPAAAALVAAPAVGQPLAAQPAIDPCCMPTDGGGVPVVYESTDQTPACPPAP